MPDTTTTTEHLTAGQLADRAAHAIYQLNHRTHPGGDDLVYPADTAAIIATLAHMTGMLPQLLAQLTRWLAHQHQTGRLTLDSLAPQPDLAPTMHALTSSLQHAIEHAQHTAAELDTAHQHATHLAAAEPATNDQEPNTATWGQNSCRSVGPNHLTKRSRGAPVSIAGPKVAKPGPVMRSHAARQHNRRQDRAPPCRRTNSGTRRRCRRLAPGGLGSPDLVNVVVITRVPLANCLSTI